MTSNQHREQERRADSKLLEEAIQHLRLRMQLASGGWSAEPSDEGRHLIGSGSEVFREVVIETYGPFAPTIVDYLLTVEPDHTRTLLALLGELQRGISTGEITGGTRRAAVRYAQDVLGYRADPSGRRRPAP